MQLPGDHRLGKNGLGDSPKFKSWHSLSYFSLVFKFFLVLNTHQRRNSKRLAWSFLGNYYCCLHWCPRGPFWLCGARGSVLSFTPRRERRTGSVRHETKSITSIKNHHINRILCLRLFVAHSEVVTPSIKFLSYCWNMCFVRSQLY